MVTHTPTTLLMFTILTNAPTIWDISVSVLKVIRSVGKAKSSERLEIDEAMVKLRVTYRYLYFRACRVARMWCRVAYRYIGFDLVSPQCPLHFPYLSQRWQVTLCTILPSPVSISTRSNYPTGNEKKRKKKGANINGNIREEEVMTWHCIPQHSTAIVKNSCSER